jgi:hypothetical protein
MNVEQEYEESEKNRLIIEAKKRQVQETGVIPGSTAEKLERIQSLRENAGFFTEGSALTTVQKILQMQEETIRLKETLNEFSRDQTEILNDFSGLQSSIDALTKAQKETNVLLDAEFKARDATRTRDKELADQISKYLNDWK